MTRSLNGKVALVTGGAGGIGSAICRRLASAEMAVIVTYTQNQDKAAALVKSLEGDNHLVMQAPVDDSRAQAALAQAVQEKYGRLDLLVNNAGITQPVPHHDLDSLTDEMIDEIFRVNVRGALASIRALKTLLMSGEGGLVINISSIAARTAFGSNVAYCASKAALDNLHDESCSCACA